MLDKSLRQNPMFKLLEGRDGADAEAYAGLLLLVESDAREALEYIKAVFPGFTTHGMGHSLRILEKIERILSDGLREELSACEIFCLMMAAMFHDMGMAKAAEPDKDRQREHHHLYAEGPLEEFMSQRLTLVKEWRRLYNCILFVCKAHGMERGALYGDKSFYDKDMIEGGVLRFGLLAVLLRVGDLLDLDENRTSEFARRLNAHYFQDETSQLHHIRHEHVDRVYLTPEVIEIEVRAENVEEYHLWEWWLDYLEGDILHANTHLMPKLGSGLMLPEPKCKVKKAEGADFETEELRFELTEKGRIWTILSKSVYTEEFDFIREIVQNGIDAVLMKDYAASEVPLPSPSPRSWGEWTGEHKVVVAYSARQGSMMVWDTGIGMDPEEVRRFLFRIADSGHRHRSETREFPFPAIAKFGIGFVSCLSKCNEIVLLTHPASQAEGCRVRMFSNSIRAFFEKLEGQPDSGTMVCMSLKRGYPMEEVRDYLVKTFRYPSVPVEWLDLDGMDDQKEILRSAGKLKTRGAKATHGAVMSQWEFEERYELFDAVRENVHHEREAQRDTVAYLRDRLAQSYDKWRRQIYAGTLKRNAFEREMSVLLRELQPLHQHAPTIQSQLGRLLESSKKQTEKEFPDFVEEILPEIEDCTYEAAAVREQLAQAANALLSPRWRLGEAELAQLWQHHVCMVSFEERFNGPRVITDRAEALRYRGGRGLLAVQCGFTDWELGVEWRSLHCFLFKNGELLLKLSDMSVIDDVDDEEMVDVEMEELLEFADFQDFNSQELMEAYVERLEYATRDSVTLRFSSLQVGRGEIIQTNEEQREALDAYGEWHMPEEAEPDSNDFLWQLAVGLEDIFPSDSIAIGDIGRIESGFYQDGIPLDVDPTDLVPLGMCRARVNLSAGARMELNITRRHVDEAHEVMDKWISEVGSKIQMEVVGQLIKTVRDWGFQGEIGSLCTGKEGPGGYFGRRCMEQLRTLEQTGAL